METGDETAGVVMAGADKGTLTPYPTRPLRPELELSIGTSLRALGVPINSEHFRDTPRRIASLWREFFNPDADPIAVLRDGFEHESSTAMVVQTQIPFRMLCAHHFAPATGFAAIGYIPDSRIVGLSKLARLVDVVGTKLPSTQEEITDTIANTLSDGLRPKGVIVVTQAEHTCMTARGIKAPGTRTTVSAVRGILMNPAPRQEFFSLAKI